MTKTAELTCYEKDGAWISLSDPNVYARVIADSIANGHRVTTFQICFWRAVLAEFNTHRLFSRNSASSRAIPLAKMIARILKAVAQPIVWPAEQKGMQGGDPLTEDDQFTAAITWGDAAHEAIQAAERLGKIRVHKSVANRLLEPFMYHTAVVTATNWDGFWSQRCSPLAQPEIRIVAEAMRAAYDASTPTEISESEWHLPYIDPEDVVAAEMHTYDNPTPGSRQQQMIRLLVQMSAARCARVSYLTQDGKRDIVEDLRLYENLVSARPPHWSPLEHPCTPWPDNVMVTDLHYTDLDGVSQHAVVTVPRVGNFLGFRQHRFEAEIAAAA